MAKISLRAYTREIEGLIEHGQRIDEAIAHCRHILKTFPKHLETYRLLGKAYLEAKRYAEAVDIFQRVLVVTPEDFVSHVGMSIIADEQGKLDEAIWHMERAFEMQPSNAAIQGELQRLFGQRDGVEPPKIRLTRGALARMYMQGELYAQAISEIKAVLSADAKRVDMQVLLAKAYFSSGQKTEATAICTELLSSYPYCLDANRIMAEIVPGTQRAESVQEFRQRVNELDPYAAQAQESLFHLENVPDGAVSLERLDYTGPLADQGAVTGLGLEEGSTRMGRGARESSRLTGGGAAQLAQETSPESKEEIPAFLKQAGWDNITAGSEEAPPTFVEQSEPEPAAVPGDLPAWVKALAPAEENQPPAEFATATETPGWLQSLGREEPAEAAPAAAAAVETEVPDWLKDLGGRELDEPEPPKPSKETDWSEGAAAVQSDMPAEAAAEESPDWLKDFGGDLESPIRSTPVTPRSEVSPVATPEPSAGIGALGTTAQEQDDAMAWLESLAAKHGAKPEELVTDPNARTAVAPDWVDKAKEIGEQAPPESVSPSDQRAGPTFHADDDATGMWLRNLDTTESGVEAPEAATGTAASGQAFDWISGLSEKDDFADTETGGEEEAPIMEARDAPAWLGDLGGRSVPPSAVGEPPAWLNPEATASAQPESGVPREAPDDSAVSLPEWLAGLDKEGSAAPSAPSSDEQVPVWLRPEAEPEPRMPERTQPTDWQPAEPGPWAEPEIGEMNAAPEGSMAASFELEGPGRVSVPARPRPGAVVSRPESMSLALLQAAQSELGRGNIAAALDIYAKLIRRGKSLEEIIRDLRDALYRYPVEVPIWQALGDAYMRANRLQEALDAYTKAEELLR